jgi:phage baseplate assembly protein gpV
MPKLRTNVTPQETHELSENIIRKAIEKIKTMSIWKVVAVNPNQTVNIECCYLDLVLDAMGSIFSCSVGSGIRRYSEFAPGILVDIPYRVRRNGQFRDMVCPAVGDIGTYTPTYEDMRRWFESGEKVVVPSTMRMTTFHGTGVWEGYIQHDKDTQPDYPVDNQTRIIKSNRMTVTITDPLDENNQPTGTESVTVAMTGITLTVNANGTITLDAPSASCNINCTTANLTASSSVTVTTPETTFSGNVSIDGNATVGGTATIDGQTTVGGALSVTGNATAAEFTTTTGVGLSIHKHGGVMSGDSTTTPPVP